MDGRHHDEARPLRILQHLLYHILRGVLLYLLSADGRVGLADAGEEQTEILVDLRRGAHRRTWVSRYHLLFDGDSGWDTLDEVALGLVHPPEELTGIARQTLHIAALTFGIQRVEGQRRFAGATDSGNYGEGVTGDLDVNVLQVIDPRPLDFNRIAQCSMFY